MRRDYFTCVFLGLIAGALMFVCFAPLYFVYGGTVPRDFSLFERMMSLLYAVFFIIFLPFFAAFRTKVWVNWGLAAYGILIYLPRFFYPAEALITGDDAKLTKILLAVLLRGIYGMMQAPFAALSPLIGDKAASGLVYWILPTALFWPLVLKIIRFYRRAYLSEQLNPMPKVKPAVTTAHTGPAVKPEVLGTVITAPVVAASPDEVAGKAALSQSTSEKENEIEAPEKEEAPAIPLSAPASDDKEADPIQLGASVSGEKEADPIQLSAPAAEEKKAPEVIALSAPSSDEEPSKVIELGAPSSEASGDGPRPDSDKNVENDNDTL